MSNIYDNFRGVQANKTSCYDERSAAFITEGSLSQDITHIRLSKTIQAAIVLEDREGPDEVKVFTLNSDSLLKGDYFTYDSNNYLVYEDIKITDDSVIWKKQLALECNITITLSENSYYAYFLSSLRQKVFNTLEKDAALLPDETALMVIATNSAFTIGTEFTVGTKGWKIIDYDEISNDGISYIYIERSSINNTTLETVAAEASDILHPMVEYTFNTNNGTFETDEEVNIISRTATEVIFKIPFGITNITITTENELGAEVEEDYRVIT